MSQFTRIGPIASALALLMAVACAPASPTVQQPPSSSPTQAGSASQKTVGGAGGQTEVAQKGGDTTAGWDQIVAGAQQEGELVVLGPPFPAVREALTNTFGKEFGIKISYFGGGGAEHIARLKSERAAGQFTADVIINGAPNLYRQKDEQLYAPLRPLLVRPDVTNPQSWFRNHMWWVDPEETTFLRLGIYNSGSLALNPEQVDPQTITSWSDILDPKFKGKITSQTVVRPGPGGGHAAYLWAVLGAETFKKLYVGQEVVFTDDVRQAAEWVARGTYPIGLGIDAPSIEPLRQHGLKIEVLHLPDAPGYLSSGWATMVAVDRMRHPNATQLFVNWAASDEGGEVVSKALEYLSLRSDVKSEWVPDYALPKEGIEYIDQHSHDWLTNQRQEAEKGVRSIVGN